MEIYNEHSTEPKGPVTKNIRKLLTDVTAAFTIKSITESSKQ
jgi:hypothetical protein